MSNTIFTDLSGKSREGPQWPQARLPNDTCDSDDYLGTGTLMLASGPADKALICGQEEDLSDHARSDEGACAIQVPVTPMVR